jgi:hypothetical protein
VMVPVAGLAPRGMPEVRDDQREKGELTLPSSDLALLRRTRMMLIVWIWAAALLLIAVEWLWWCALRVANRNIWLSEGGPVSTAYAWRFGTMFLPLELIILALILQFRWFRTFGKQAATAGFILMVPVHLVAFLLVHLWGPIPMDSVRLNDGRRFILASQQAGLDSVFAVYSPAGPLGFAWHPVSDVGVSGFDGNPQLALSPDQRWLLVAQHGLWADCFQLVQTERPSMARPTLDRCPAYKLGYSTPTDNTEARDRALSRQAEAMTGMRPPAGAE